MEIVLSNAFQTTFQSHRPQKILLANKVTLNFPTFPSGSLGLLLVLLVYLMTCITEDSIWLCITENLPNNNNFNKRCLILELGSPRFIRWFYEYSGIQAPSRSLLCHPYDPIWLLILQPLYPHSRQQTWNRIKRRRPYLRVPCIASIYLHVELSHTAIPYVSVSCCCITTSHKVSVAYNTKHVFSHICRLARIQLIWAGLSQALLLRATVAELIDFSQRVYVSVEWLSPTCLSSALDQRVSQDMFFSWHKESQMSKWQQARSPKVQTQNGHTVTSAHVLLKARGKKYHLFMMRTLARM